MNKVILCEGGNDAILLSYYLGKVAGWKFCKKPPADISIKPDQFEQTVNWYEKDKDRLLICGVGGNKNMANFFRSKIYHPIVDAGAFSRIAVVLDRDEREIESIEASAASIFKPVVTKAKNNKWIENVYTDAYDQEKKIDSLLVIIPKEHKGALETVMLKSISEDPYDAEIVKRSGEFVKEMRVIASKYIRNNRDELKAHLGVTWAVQYPEKVFKLINEQIVSIEWEKYEEIHECFGQLETI